MSRAGRKRKNGPRHPGGQLKKTKPRKTEIDDSVRTQRQPHRRALVHQLRALKVEPHEVEKFAAGEEAESPIGRLWASGLLAMKGDGDIQASRDRYDAGSMFAQVVGAYRSSIMAPGGVSGSGRKSSCAADLLCSIDPDECECFGRRRRYMRAYEALAGAPRIRLELEAPDLPAPLVAAIAEAQRLGGDEAYIPIAADRRRVLLAVIRLVIHQQAIGPEDLVYLVRGLEMLRQHFGLTARRKPKHYRNAK